MAAGPTSLTDLARRGLVASGESGVVAGERTVPMLAAFAPLMPQGPVRGSSEGSSQGDVRLARGSVVACHGAAAVSLALAVAAGPSLDGAWVGVVGLPSLGLAAAAELGVVLERLVAVDEPASAPFTEAQWADVLAAMIDGFDVLVVGPAIGTLRAATSRRLAARLQSRGALAVTIGSSVFAADLRLTASQPVWHGLGDGHGVAQQRAVTVECDGRRMPRPRVAHWWLPTPDGGVEPVLPGVVPDAVPGAVPDAVPDPVPLRRTG